MFQYSYFYCKHFIQGVECWCTDLVKHVVDKNISQGEAKGNWDKKKRSIEINEKEDESINP